VSDDAPVQLEYVGREPRPPLPPAWSTKPMRIVYGCWFFQLLLAVAVFVTARIQGFVIRDAFSATGAVVLVFGILIVAIASIAALVFASNYWGQTDRKWNEAVKPAVLGVLLNLSTFPIAGCMLWFGNLHP
jgi:hypothetical protein